MKLNVIYVKQTTFLPSNLNTCIVFKSVIYIEAVLYLILSETAKTKWALPIN